MKEVKLTKEKILIPYKGDSKKAAFRLKKADQNVIYKSSRLNSPNSIEKTKSGFLVDFPEQQTGEFELKALDLNDKDGEKSNQKAILVKGIIIKEDIQEAKEEEKSKNESGN